MQQMPRVLPSAGVSRSTDGQPSRVTSGPFRYVVPHGYRFDVHFHEPEAPEALDELRRYRADWAERLRALEQQVETLAAETQPPAHAVGRLESALRTFRHRPPRELVMLRYEAEEIRRTLGTIDDAIARLERFVAARDLER
jgi:hypothetical protein